MNKKKYNKSYRILQWVLLVGIILAYSFYLLTADGTSLGGVVPPIMVNQIVIMILILQLQTMLDMYNKLNITLGIIFGVVIASYAAYLAITYYVSNLNTAFSVVLGLIALANGVNTLRMVRESKAKG